MSAVPKWLRSARNGCVWFLNCKGPPDTEDLKFGHRVEVGVTAHVHVHGGAIFDAGSFFGGNFRRFFLLEESVAPFFWGGVYDVKPDFFAVLRSDKKTVSADLRIKVHRKNSGVRTLT